MKHNQIPALLLALALLLSGCSPAAGVGEPSATEPEPLETDTVPVEAPLESPSEPPEESPEEFPEEAEPTRTVGDIWLYGEVHGDKDVLEEELRLWQAAYDRGVRHMFIEYPYYTAEYLNLWMAAEDDTILEELYADWVGTQAHNENVKAFYRSIKANCPETVFHGTDVGHQYDTAGERYLSYLRENGQEGTEQYRLAQGCVQQGMKYYGSFSIEYRESRMEANFVRELEGLDGEEIMGFYGGAHIGMDSFGYDGQTVKVSMAKRLLKRYGEKLHVLGLGYLSIPELEPERIDTIRVGERTYEGSYFGKADISIWSDTYRCREFWRLEGAYDDFRDAPTTGSVLPYDNYPTRIEEGQVFVIDYTRKDGTVERKFYRSGGNMWQGMLTTEELYLVPELEPERIDAIQVGKRTYEASYFGKVDLSAWSDTYFFREFWRLEGAYDDFRDAPKTGNVLPYSNYPTRVEEGQIFVIDYTRKDGTVERQFMRSDGDTWQGMPTTVNIVPEG